MKKLLLILLCLPFIGFGQCDSGPFGPLGCETFLECGTSTNKAYHFAGGPASFTNTLFHSFVGSPSVGQVVELQKNDGTNSEQRRST